MSLENKLKPRLKQAQEAGIVIDRGCIQRMGKYNDTQWATSIAYQKKQLLKAKSGMMTNKLW